MFQQILNCFFWIISEALFYITLFKAMLQNKNITPFNVWVFIKKYNSIHVCRHTHTHDINMKVNLSMPRFSYFWSTHLLSCSSLKNYMQSHLHTSLQYQLFFFYRFKDNACFRISLSHNEYKSDS